MGAIEGKMNGRIGGIRRKGNRKGEEVENSRGVTSMGVERETRLEKRNREEEEAGNQRAK